MKRFFAFIFIQIFLVPFSGYSQENKPAQENKPEIVVRQIIRHCVQEGDSPCAVGVDNRTITYDNRVFEVNDKVIALLEQSFKEFSADLNFTERNRFTTLLAPLKRIDRKLTKIQRKLDALISKLGISQNAIDDLHKTLSVKDRVVLNLLETIDEKKVLIGERDAQLQALAKKYNELEERLAKRPVGDVLARKAKNRLAEGDLEGAGKLLEASLEEKLKSLSVMKAAAAADAFDLGSLEILRLRYKKARDYYKQAVLLEPKKSEYLIDFGSLLHSLGEYEFAIKNYNNALSIGGAVEKDALKTAVLYNNLGAAWRRLGNLNKAKENHEKALEIELRILGKNNPKVALTYNNLGEIWDAFGEHEKAIKYYHKALKIDLAVLKSAHPKLAVLYNNLGEAWRKSGNTERAINYFEKALDIYLRVFKKGHPILATTYNNLGVTWSRLGALEKAMTYFERALEIDRSILGENHPGVATRYNNIGEVWRKRGKFEKAISYYEKALEIDLAVFGEKHPNVGIRYNNLGVAWKKRGEIAKSREFYEKAMTIFSEQYGDRHPFTVNVQSNLQGLEAYRRN